MKREESRIGCFGMIPEKRRDKLAALKKAIREGAYKVKAEEIAEKILKERLFELALTLYNQKYQKCRNNSIAWPGNKANNLSLKSGKKEEPLAEMKTYSTFSRGTLRPA
jgi:hypothetical protein